MHMGNKEASYFTPEHRRKLVNVLNMKIKYRNKKMYMCNMIENYVEQFASLIMERDNKIVFPDVNEFINSYVIGNGLDRRTEKAYRMDLEHFYVWADSKARADVGGGKAQQEKTACRAGTACQEEIVCQAKATCEEWMEAYLDYLSMEKNLSFSTVYRKKRVLGYYLSYLVRQGVLDSCRPLKPVAGTEKKNRGTQFPHGLLSRKDGEKGAKIGRAHV